MCVALCECRRGLGDDVPPAQVDHVLPLYLMDPRASRPLWHCRVPCVPPGVCISLLYVLAVFGLRVASLLSLWMLP